MAVVKLNVTYKPFILSVIMLNVTYKPFMLIVMVPQIRLVNIHICVCVRNTSRYTDCGMHGTKERQTNGGMERNMDRQKSKIVTYE